MRSVKSKLNVGTKIFDLSPEQIAEKKEQIVKKQKSPTASSNNNGPVPPEFENFVGYWLLDNIDDWMVSTMIQFFVEDDMAKAKVYAGTQNELREMSLADNNYAVLSNAGDLLTIPSSIVDVTNDTMDVEVLSDTELRLYNTLAIGTLPNGPDQLQSTFKIQSYNNDLAYSQLWTAWDGTSDNQAYGEIENLMRFKRLDHTPQIQNRDELTNKWTNPLNLFDYVYNVYLNISQTERRESAQCEQYIGNVALHQLYLDLRNVGVVRQNSVSLKKREGIYIGVWKTVPNPALSVQVTTFRLMKRNYFSNADRVTISGFVGEYAVMNGTHDVSLLVGGSEGPRYKSEWQLPESNEFTVHVDFDSSNLPTYNPDVHGFPSLVSQHGPITETTEYRDLVIALADLQNAFGTATHNDIFVYGNPTTGKIYETFGEVSLSLSQGTLFPVTVKGRSRGQSQGRDNLYHNPVLLPGSIQAPIFDTNDPFGLGQEVAGATFGSKWDIDIDLDNYLDKCKTYNVWYAVTGPTDPDVPITEQLKDQYGSNGSQVAFKAVKFGENPADLVDVYGTHPYNLFQTYANSLLETIEVQRHRNMLGGIVHKKYTKSRKNECCCNCKGCDKGETVAYIRILDMLGFDGGDLLTKNSLVFGRDDWPENRFLSNHVASLAVLLEKLNRHKPDRYIIDIRENQGGIISLGSAWGSLFGGNRTSANTKTIFDFSNRPLMSKIVNNSEIESVNNGTVHNANVLAQINTDEVAARFPKAIVRGRKDKPVKVVILDNVNAASAGDMFPHNFIGTDKDPRRGIHDIGNHVTAEIIGDIDGRLYNSTSFHAAPINNPNPFKFFGVLDLSPILLVMEAGINMSNDTHGTVCNQQTWTKPSKLVPSWYEKQWQDIGIINLVHKYPIKCKKKPKFNNNKTWRDLALEHAITHK